MLLMYAQLKTSTLLRCCDVKESLGNGIRQPTTIEHMSAPQLGHSGLNTARVVESGLPRNGTLRLC
jgi:hypothetical protein